MPFPFANTYARLPETFFARVDPTPVSAPQLIAINSDLASDLGIAAGLLNGDDACAFLSGNRIPEGAEPLAMAYSGHQFGGFSPQLGDGRAILLGEVVGRDGRRRDIQLKGSGPTPYSRRGDGRSALGPVLREYLVSEAMAALGVPTTRALAAVSSGDRVYREEMEPGGVFTRVASSHLRIGTVEYFASRGDHVNLRVLADYVIERHYPEAKEAENTALALLEGVIARQASLVAHWMQFGFIHGVMNTDNMSLSGETIDYGPCAFLDQYDPAKKFSFIDQQGRYAFGNQPKIAHWNLTRLAESLLPLLATDEDAAIELAKEALGTFPDQFRSAHLSRMAAKIGIEKGGEHDWPLVDSLLQLMQDQEADFTLTFRHLRRAATGDQESFLKRFPRRAPVIEWLAAWHHHLQDSNISAEIAASTMRQANPVFIPRNHRIEEVIQAGKQGDFGPFHRFLEVLQHPFEEQLASSDYENPPEPHERVRATFCGT